MAVCEMNVPYFDDNFGFGRLLRRLNLVDAKLAFAEIERNSLTAC